MALSILFSCCGCPHCTLTICVLVPVSSSGCGQIARDAPMCDFWKRQGGLSWHTTDDLDHSDSECEEQEVRSYKVNTLATPIQTHNNNILSIVTTCRV